MPYAADVPLILQSVAGKDAEDVTSLTHHGTTDQRVRVTRISHLGPYRNLQHLDLSGNLVKHIDGLRHLRHLRSLDLSSNRLQELQGLQGLTSLHRLNVSGNFIARIPTVISTLQLLQSVDLSGNQLAVMKDVQHLQPLANLTSLNLAANPFSSLPHYSDYVVFTLKCVTELDGSAVAESQRKRAMRQFDPAAARAEAQHRGHKAAQQASAATVTSLRAENEELAAQLKHHREYIERENQRWNDASAKVHQLERHLAFMHIDQAPQGSPASGEADTVLTPIKGVVSLQRRSLREVVTVSSASITTSDVQQFTALFEGSEASLLQPAVRQRLHAATARVAELTATLARHREAVEGLQQRRDVVEGERDMLREQLQELRATVEQYGAELQALRAQLGDDAPDVDDPDVVASSSAKARLQAATGQLRGQEEMLAALRDHAAAINSIIAARAEAWMTDSEVAQEAELEAHFHSSQAKVVGVGALSGEVQGLPPREPFEEGLASLTTLLEQVNARCQSCEGEVQAVKREINMHEAAVLRTSAAPSVRKLEAVLSSGTKLSKAAAVARYQRLKGEVGELREEIGHTEAQLREVAGTLQKVVAEMATQEAAMASLEREVVVQEAEVRRAQHGAMCELLQQRGTVIQQQAAIIEDLRQQLAQATARLEGLPAASSASHLDLQAQPQPHPDQAESSETGQSRGEDVGGAGASDGESTAYSEVSDRAIAMALQLEDAGGEATSPRSSSQPSHSQSQGQEVGVDRARGGRVGQLRAAASPAMTPAFASPRPYIKPSPQSTRATARIEEMRRDRDSIRRRLDSVIQGRGMAVQLAGEGDTPAQPSSQPAGEAVVDASSADVRDDDDVKDDDVVVLASTAPASSSSMAPRPALTVPSRDEVADPEITSFDLDSLVAEMDQAIVLMANSDKKLLSRTSSITRRRSSEQGTPGPSRAADKPSIISTAPASARPAKQRRASRGSTPRSRGSSMSQAELQAVAELNDEVASLSWGEVEVEGSDSASTPRHLTQRRMPSTGGSSSQTSMARGSKAGRRGRGRGSGSGSVRSSSGGQRSSGQLGVAEPAESTRRSSSAAVKRRWRSAAAKARALSGAVVVAPYTLEPISVGDGAGEAGDAEAEVARARRVRKERAEARAARARRVKGVGRSRTPSAAVSRQRRGSGGGERKVRGGKSKTPRAKSAGRARAGAATPAAAAAATTARQGAMAAQRGTPVGAGKAQLLRGGDVEGPVYSTPTAPAQRVPAVESRAPVAAIAIPGLDPAQCFDDYSEYKPVVMKSAVSSLSAFTARARWQGTPGSMTSAGVTPISRGPSPYNSYAQRATPPAGSYSRAHVAGSARSSRRG